MLTAAWLLTYVVAASAAWPAAFAGACVVHLQV
jgi:hypothetical protein